MAESCLMTRGSGDTVSGDLKLLSGGQAENVSVSLSVFFLKI